MSKLQLNTICHEVHFKEVFMMTLIKRYPSLTSHYSLCVTLSLFSLYLIFSWHLCLPRCAMWSSGWRDGLPMVRFGVRIPAMAEMWFEISAPPAPPIANSAVMSTLTYLRCQREDCENWSPALICRG